MCPPCFFGLGCGVGNGFGQLYLREQGQTFLILGSVTNAATKDEASDSNDESVSQQTGHGEVIFKRPDLSGIRAVGSEFAAFLASGAWN
jgi:hypothetical protein